MMIIAMTKKARGAIRTGCIVLGLFIGIEVQAQPPQRQAVPIQHEVAVTLKLVQVYVTDKEGSPVPDLLAADFDLFDNGKSMTITDFEKHTLFTPGKPGEAEEKSLEPSVSRLNRKFFLFFDFAFNNPQGLEQAKRAALHFLAKEVRPSDEVGIISYSIYQGLTLHEYLTTDRQKLRDVVEGFNLKNILGRAQNLETEYWNALKDLLGEPHLAVPKTIPDGWLNPAKQKLLELSVDRMNYQLHVRNFTQKMRDLAKTLRLIPGYKHIILFSSGIAGSVFQGAPDAIDRSKLEASQRAGNATLYNMDSLDVGIWEEKKYENMIKELAQANCPVFVLNTEELGQGSSFNKAKSGEYPLKKLSKISGGEYFPHVEDYENSLARVQNRTGMYYVLGYYIEGKEDSKFHEIKVGVRRKGCEVRAQGGYFNPKPFREYSEFEKTVHLMDAALTENPQFQTPAAFPVTALACPTEKENVLVLLSRIPKDIFDSAEKSQNEVVTLIFDSQKNIANFKRATIDFAAVAQPAACHYTFSILRPGEYECRIIIRNLETGQTAVARESVLIPEASDLPLALLPPLLLRPESDIYYFGVQKRQGEEANAKTMSLTSLFPFDAKQFSPLLGELQAGSPKMNAMVICALGDILEPELELSFFLKKDPSGSEIPITHSILSAKRYSRDEDNRSWLALLSQLEFSDLKPGSYILKARARETTTNFEAESAQKLDVK